MSSPALQTALPCASKVPYETAEQAATVGRKASAERSVSLWTYRCTHCFNWHLTKQDQGPYFAVSAPQTEPDDFVDLPGEGPFWWRIEQLPHEEVIVVLQELLKNISAEQSRLGSSGWNYTARQKLLSDLSKKVSMELHFKNQAVNRKAFLDAVKTVLGEDIETAVRVEVARVVQSQSLYAEGGCELFVRYEDEIEARTQGAKVSKQSRSDLWVFPCAHCCGWHVTTRERASHWSVNTPISAVEDYLDLLEDRGFWHRIIDMPRIDLERQLRCAIHSVSVRLDQTEGAEHRRLVRLARILKDEMIIIGKSRADVPTRKVLVSMYGEEAFERIRPLLPR